MLRITRNKQGQSTAEYAILIGLIIAVAVGMQTYVKRGLQGKTKDAADDHVIAIENEYKGITDPDVIANMNAAVTTAETQYEPLELSSKSTQKVSADTETSDMAEDGTIARTSTRTTEQEAGDYQKYGY